MNNQQLKQEILSLKLRVKYLEDNFTEQDNLKDREKELLQRVDPYSNEGLSIADSLEKEYL